MGKLILIMSRSFRPNYPTKTDAEIEQIILENSRSWMKYVAIRRELREIGLVKSYRPPEVKFSEWLVKSIFNGVFPYRENNKFWDVETIDKKIQVKSISKALENRNDYRITHADRSNLEATHYVFVIFRDFVPVHIFIVESKRLREFKRNSLGVIELRELGEEISFFKDLFINRSE